jgi:outer membrane biosynthesis protein TonB
VVAFALAAEAVFIARSGGGGEDPVVEISGTAEVPHLTYHPRPKKPSITDVETDGAGESTELPGEEIVPSETGEAAPEPTEEEAPPPPEPKPEPQPPKPPEER